jgi:tetratricopeptide (TPR) repeat protein
VGWLWFLIALVPTIGIIQAGFQAMADRFAYLPIIGLWIMIVWGVNDSLRSGRVPQLVTSTISTAALAACVVLTCFQLGHWKNSITLFEHAVQVTPDNFLAHNNLGSAYLEARRIDDAMRSTQEALRLNPKSPLSHFLLGLIYDLQGSLDSAVREYETAIDLAPALIEPQRARANALARLGETKQAIAGFETILQRDPRDVEVRYALALLLVSEKRTREAIEQYRQLLRLMPDSPDALNDLAWLLATDADPALRSGREAVQYAERACELTRHRQPLFLGTLAAAYAEAGRFSEAITAAENGMRMALTVGDTNLADTNKNLVELFSSGKPLRKP